MKPRPPVLARTLAVVAALFLCNSTQAQKTPLLERGTYLMNGIVACGNCHMARGAQGEPLPAQGLSGGMVFDEAPFKALASNITPDPETGIGKWTDAQLVTAIREGRRPDGSLIGPPMPIGFYRSMSDTDAAAIVAYLRAQPPVRKAVAKSVYNMPLPPSYGPPLKAVQAPPAGDKLKTGAYLAQIGHCMECHTPRGTDGRLQMPALGAGGQVFRGPWGESLSRNLTPHASGLKDWTDAQVIKAIREGVDRDGKPYRPPMAYAYYKNISDADMALLVGYLRSLKPQALGGKS
jgi:mono/diheme cytochrome c family protein